MPHGALSLALWNGLPEAYSYFYKSIEIFMKWLKKHNPERNFNSRKENPKL